MPLKLEKSESKRKEDEKAFPVASLSMSIVLECAGAGPSNSTSCRFLQLSTWIWGPCLTWHYMVPLDYVPVADRFCWSTKITNLHTLI